MFVGSGIGGLCRYWVSFLTERSALLRNINSVKLLGDFPVATLIVNLAGCFVIGLLYGLIDRGVELSPSVRLFLTTGFCGGLTTFSTFSHENYLLFETHNYATLIIYLLVSLLFGFLMAMLGHAAARI